MVSAFQRRTSREHDPYKPDFSSIGIFWKAPTASF